jgi:LysR family cys regulon transcriptional activator
MRLEQLECLCEIVRQGYSVSGAAAALHTSQPAVSRQLRALERELGVDIFVRNHKRLTGATAPGEDVIAAGAAHARRGLEHAQDRRDTTAAEQRHADRGERPTLRHATRCRRSSSALPPAIPTWS